jgi:hypothetical protein
LQLGLARVRRQLGRPAELELQLARLRGQLHLDPLGEQGPGFPLQVGANG